MRHSSASWVIFILVLSVLPAFNVRAEEYELELLETVPIYEKPELSAKVIGRAQTGQKLKSEQRPKRAFYIVEFPSKSGKLRRGYIAVNEAGFSRVKEAKTYLKSRNAVGVSAIYSMQNQGKRELQTAEDTTYDITEFTGNTTFFRLFFDIPIEKTRWAGRLGVSFRTTSMTGDAKVQGGTTTSNLRLEQTFVGIDGLLKHYLWRDRFWLGGGIEAAKGTSVSVKSVSGPAIDDSDVKMPFFTILSASAGYDFGSYADHIFITPEMRVGGVVTTDPFTMLFEAIINLGWAF